MAAPARTHSGDNTIGPFYSYINGAKLFAFLFVWSRHSGNTDGIVSAETLANGMSHSTSCFFADDAILFDHFMRDTHLLLDFGAVGSNTTNEILGTALHIRNSTGKEATS